MTSKLTWGQTLLILLALACCIAVALASLRHTGSLAFPIDDGYIYSNYVLQAAQWHPFIYNPGESSGGITGIGWYLLCTLSYWVLAPLYALLGGLGPPAVQGDVELSRQAAHLYLAAYIPGAICLAFAALGVYRLALLTFPASDGRSEARGALCWLAGAVAAADLGLVWGAMSGLELALSAALVVWAVVALLDDVRQGQMRWSLLLAALLPWARPDLLVIPVCIIFWLLLRAVWGPDHSLPIPKRWGNIALYAGATLAGTGLMSAVYLAGWGKPLPSSFYAKVGGLRLGSRFFSAAVELWVAGRVLPFVVGALSLAGGVLQLLLPPGHRKAWSSEDTESRWSAGLLLVISVSYVAATLLTLPWFGQEDRYLIPVHPFVIVLLVGLVWWLVRALPSFVLPAKRVPAVLIVLALAVFNYLWATRNYVVEVRNIADGHIQPALWLAENVTKESIVASEPIGAVKLFSGRKTIDLVGLTTPATLGTYRNWPRAWQALRDAGADYLLFYPAWFDNQKPPAWAIEAQRFVIPDNRIAGDRIISIYRLDWTKMPQP